jgi:MFS family permease
MEALLPAGSDVKYYSGIATTVFMIGWAVGRLYFGMLSDRWGRAKTMMLAIIVYAGLHRFVSLCRRTNGTSWPIVFSPASESEANSRRV